MYINLAQYIYIYIYICWARFLKEENIKEKLIHLPGRRNVLGKFKEVATRLSGVITSSKNLNKEFVRRTNL